ncbi:hypothetical protein [Yersinia enterocolitica]|uniref:hypothetical protein n=1 Tax=Yersinia enterocolitica TaxID=630 RepID=UPI0030CC9457
MTEKEKFMDNYGAIYAASLFVLMNENNFTPEEIDFARKCAETASIEIMDRGYKPSSFNTLGIPSTNASKLFDVKFLSIDGHSKHIVGGYIILNMIKTLYPSFAYYRK